MPINLSGAGSVTIGSYNQVDGDQQIVSHTVSTINSNGLQTPTTNNPSTTLPNASSPPPPPPQKTSPRTSGTKRADGTRGYDTYDDVQGITTHNNINEVHKTFTARQTKNSPPPAPFDTTSDHDARHSALGRHTTQNIRDQVLASMGPTLARSGHSEVNVSAGRVQVNFSSGKDAENGRGPHVSVERLSARGNTPFQSPSWTAPSQSTHTVHNVNSGRSEAIRQSIIASPARHHAAPSVETRFQGSSGTVGTQTIAENVISQTFVASPGSYTGASIRTHFDGSSGRTQTTFISGNKRTTVVVGPNGEIEEFPSNQPSSNSNPQSFAAVPSLDAWLLRTNIERSTWDHVGKLEPTTEPLKRLHNQAFHLTETWLQNPATSTLWLHGSHSTDLTELARRVAASHQRRRPVFSFFFTPPHDAVTIDGRARVHQSMEADDHTFGKDTYQALFASLAVQIRDYSPKLKRIMDDGAAVDPDITLNTYYADLPTQFGSLIADPLKHLAGSKRMARHCRPLIIINGVNRCQGDDSASQIVSHILSSVQEANPLALFLITSEYSEELDLEFQDMASIDIDRLSTKNL